MMERPRLKRLKSFALFLACVSVASGCDSAEKVTPVISEQTEKTYQACIDELAQTDRHWCEMRLPGKHPSISSVWPEVSNDIRMVVGPRSVLLAWNSAAYDPKRRMIYLTGGGHADYGGNEVYSFDLEASRWSRLTDPSKLTHLFIMRDYKQRADQPWRRLCKSPNTTRVPASAHTYDGWIFSPYTDTLFLYTNSAANGTCFEDKEDQYANSELVAGTRSGVGRGFYEFNPSPDKVRNGLDSLAWRRIMDVSELQSGGIGQGYPRTTQFAEGRLLLGSKSHLAEFDIDSGKIIRLFSKQADWGDGLALYDDKRKLVWSLHPKALLGFDAASGKQVARYKQSVPHGKSLAINNDGLLVSWDGASKVFTFNPDGRKREWQEHQPQGGPLEGDKRVYGKWIYIPEDDVFVGISHHKSGVWVYKHRK